MTTEEEEEEELVLDGILLKRGRDDGYEAARCNRNFALNSHHPRRRRRLERGKEEKEGDDSDSNDDIGYRPAYIAVVETVRDVQKCVLYARKRGLQVNVRTGGHNWFGCFLRDDAFLIDLRRFDGLEIVDAESRTCRVGPAVLGNELNAQAAQHGLCFSAGHCVGVPLGGFLLGGGLGWFQPYYGYAVERVLEATVVAPDGRIVTAKDNNNGDDETAEAEESEDYMYMVRGSASAFPGVVVSFKLELSVLPPIVRSRTDLYPLEEFAEIVRLLDGHVKNEKHLVEKCEITLSVASTPPPLAQVVKAPKVLMVIYTVRTG